MPKDWLEWHDLYNTEPKLQQRLEIVQEYISYSLDNSPTGTIRVVSACAGDGRDLLGNLSFLSKKGAFVLWTRGHSNGIAYSENVRKYFHDFGFEEVNFKLTATGDMGVGIHRYLGENLPTPKEEKLFVFSGVPNKAR
jgi:hypothetical protein